MKFGSRLVPLQRLAILVCLILIASGASCLSPISIGWPKSKESVATPARRPAKVYDGPLCNPETEFTCLNDNRCIAIKWRCDFTEQCLDGEDEFGCVPEWCDFSHDLCNWQTATPIGASNSSRVNHLVWHRYFNGNLPVSGIRDKAFYNLKAAKLMSSPNPNRAILTILGKLASDLRQNSRYLFSPLIYPIAHSEIQSAQADEPRTIAEFPRLVAPHIGQVNSGCQLRFRYAMWTSQHGVGSNFTTKLILELVARSKLKGADRKADPETSEPIIIWSKSLDATQPDAQARSTDWIVGVAEVGHLEQIELSFEARVTIVGLSHEDRGLNDEKIDEKSGLFESALPEATLPGQVSTTKTMETASTVDKKTPCVQLYGSLVAIAEFHFHTCSWPQGLNESCRLNLAALNKTSPNLNDWDYVYEQFNQSDVDVCCPNQFRCSNGICLERHKLCNFVNDCMDEQAEDEARSLCGSVLGMENFESRDMSINEAWLAYNNQSFWTLASNWPENEIKIQDSLGSAAHLPRHDHTLGKPEGHYLSFEIPHNGRFITLGKQIQFEAVRNFYWIYLDSPWMRKLTSVDKTSGHPIEGDDCRVKLFYNIIINDASGGIYERMQAYPLKLYLAVEHFTLLTDTNMSSARILGTTRRLDTIANSHPADTSVSMPSNDGSIEYLGLDFWREANIKISGIKDGEIYYLRIALIIELGKSWGSDLDQKATMNIDDLATHFGCGFVDDRNELSKFRDIKHKLTINFSLTDYMKEKQKQSDLLHDLYSKQKIRSEICAIQFEPHKLIMYVVAVLSSIIGLITLIVFVFVPYVERITISYHDQIAIGVSDIGDAPRCSLPSIIDTCELTTESDWEQISRRWRRATYNETLVTESVVAISNSQSRSNKLDSIESYDDLVNACSIPKPGDKDTNKDHTQ